MDSENRQQHQQQRSRFLLPFPHSQGREKWAERGRERVRVRRKTVESGGGGGVGMSYALMAIIQRADTLVCGVEIRKKEWPVFPLPFYFPRFPLFFFLRRALPSLIHHRPSQGFWVVRGDELIFPGKLHWQEEFFWKRFMYKNFLPLTKWNKIL